MPSIVMPSAIIRSVIMPSVIEMSVITPGYIFLSDVEHHYVFSSITLIFNVIMERVILFSGSILSYSIQGIL
jgi:hypothetical protein